MQGGGESATLPDGEATGDRMRDHDAEARDLIGALAAAGFAERSARLQNAIEGGATGTEIVMTLRWELQQLLDGERDLPPPLRARARRLRRGLRQALDSAAAGPAGGAHGAGVVAGVAAGVLAGAMAGMLARGDRPAALLLAALAAAALAAAAVVLWVASRG